MDALLGTKSDRETAENLGLSKTAIRIRRIELGIPLKELPRPVPTNKFNWTPEIEAQLGTMSDQRLAEKLGVSSALVHKRRKLLGIAAKGNTVANDWTPAMDALLGTMSDRETAEMLGLSKAAIRIRRIGLGIPIKELPRPVPTNKFNWTPEIEAQLGTMSDWQLAEKLGVSRAHVANRRKLLGITSKVDPRATSVKKFDPFKFNWTPERDALLGTDHDKVIGQLLGISHTSIRVRRNILNIAPYVKIPSAREWSVDQDALLGTAPDSKLAAQWGIPSKAVRSRRMQKNIPEYEYASRWTPHMNALLGTMSDSGLAKKLGLPYSAVRARRLELGITSAFEKHWTPENIALLGTMSDRKLALRMGVSRTAVMNRRKDLGIEMQDKSQQGKKT